MYTINFKYQIEITITNAPVHIPFRKSGERPTFAIANARNLTCKKNPKTQKIDFLSIKYRISTSNINDIAIANTLLKVTPPKTGRTTHLRHRYHSPFDACGVSKYTQKIDFFGDQMPKIYARYEPPFCIFISTMVSRNGIRKLILIGQYSVNKKWLNLKA